MASQLESRSRNSDFANLRSSDDGAGLNLREFRQIVSQSPARISPHRCDLHAQYVYLGLDTENSYQGRVVSDALYERIRNSFASGHGEVRRICRALKTDLIREHVIEGVPLDPYFEVLNHIEDALTARASSSGAILGNWTTAIQAAQDHIEISNLRMVEHRRIFPREFAVADAARLLKQLGYEIVLEPDLIALERRSERSVRRKIEKLITQLGAVEVLRRIFAEITPLYDGTFERYHLVPHMSPLGGGTAQVPWGYLLQLAVKHINSPGGAWSSNEHWQRLITLVTAYAAVVDVQPYYPPVFRNFDAHQLLQFSREQALYDSMFRFLQLRASDVLKICRGALSFLHFGEPTPSGWTLREAFEVIGYLLDPVRDIRGPVTVTEDEFLRALPHISKDTISILLREVLAHPVEGANQRFSKPTDGPNPEDKSIGADFFLKPLIRLPNDCYLIVDRSACGWGYVEALLTALRPHHKQFDDKVGVAIEGFLRGELSSRGVPTVGGDYDLSGEHGECDLVAETPQTVIFIELKKKSLTRRARAGVDADLLLDLAGSLLAGQAQAGWHELRLKNVGSLDLVRNGQHHTLTLGDRNIEKIAMGMMDFGSFQDRPMLDKFMAATLNASFGSPDPGYNKRFEAINEALQQIRDQYKLTHEGKAEIRQPFFNCWFMSIPQLLVILDEVTDANSFKETLWRFRHMTTGSSDLYFEISRMRKLRQ